ncbi:hypothetical protein U1Q18_046134, partial [Sarracenia purpurea var. burkii]
MPDQCDNSTSEIGNTSGMNSTIDIGFNGNNEWEKKTFNKTKLWTINVDGSSRKNMEG